MINAYCTQPIQAELDLNKGLLAAGGAIIGSAILFGKWLFSESDQKLLIRAQDTCNRVYNDFAEIIATFDQLFGITPNNISYVSQEQIVYNFSEKNLYALATQVWQMDIRQSWVRSHARSSIQLLRDLRNQLLNRINALNAELYAHPETREVIDPMYKFVQYIDMFLPHLELLSKYIEKHASYFNLYDCDGQTRNYYGPLLQVIERYQHDSYLCASQVKRFILSQSRAQYPLISYLQTLGKHITDLEYAFRKTDYRYGERVGWAKQLNESLQYIKAVIISDVQYQEELRDKEWQRVEQKQIAILHEQARLEKERSRLERERLAHTQAQPRRIHFTQ